MDWPAAHRFLEELGPGARRDFLRVLTSSSEVRADMIRQFHERGSEMAEALILLEEQEWVQCSATFHCSDFLSSAIVINVQIPVRRTELISRLASAVGEWDLNSGAPSAQAHRTLRPTT
jgi:hypothetical protein